MSRIVWHETGKKIYETGLKQGVLYPLTDGAYPKGVAWNGLTAFNKNPSGAEPTALWADDTKYLNLMSAEEFGASLEAYTYPDEFNPCLGYKEVAPGVVVGQQERQGFGLCVRTTVGNDANGIEYGYKLHIVYGCLASPSETSYSTINDSPEAMTLSWEISTTPVNVTGFNPTAYLEIDSTKVAADKMKALEDILYGTETAEARLPMPDEIADVLKAA